MASDALTVLIVEDEPAIAELLAFTLRAEGWTVATAGTVAQAWAELQRGRRPDLILLDWMLPDQSGLSLLGRIRANRDLQALPVIMLTARAMEEDKIAGLNQGADDYVTKPFSPRELIARVAAVMRRKTPEYSDLPMRHGSITLNPGNCTVQIHADTIEIGHAEYRLLKFLLAHPERVFTRQQLLDRVWGDRAVIEERTVDVHILRLRKALKGAENMIHTMRGIGYMLSAT